MHVCKHKPSAVHSTAKALMSIERAQQHKQQRVAHEECKQAVYLHKLCISYPLLPNHICC